MYFKITFSLFLFCYSLSLSAIEIVAAENFYGNIAKQIGGPHVVVTSILSNPNQDPHLFSSSASTAKAIAHADLIIYNGLDYDPWITNLIGVNLNKKSLVVADLLGKKAGENPHIWYDPNTMIIFAHQLADILSQLNVQNKEYFQTQLRSFKEDYKRLFNKIAQLKQRYQGSSITATEPIFDYMADSLGLKMLGKGFQLSIMNGTPPSAKDIKEFEDVLTRHEAKVLIYNNQVSNPITERMRSLAQKVGVPTVGVSEIEPADRGYVNWMIDQLNSLEGNLSN